MAIRFNIESQETCWRAYLNYHCYGNTMNISPEEMGAIVNRWSDQIPMWQENANTKDEVKYKFDDSEFENIKTESYNNTKDTYGDDVNTKGEKGRQVGDGTGVALGGALGAAGALKGAADLGMLGGKLGGKIASIGGGKNWISIAGKDGATSAGKAGSWVGFILSAASCIVAHIVGAVAKNNVANKEEHAAVMELQEQMGEQQQALTTETNNMAKYEEEIIALADEAQKEQETSAQTIENQKVTFDMSNRTYLNLKGKLQRGEALTAGERALYNSSISKLSTTSDTIDITIVDATETVQGKGAEIAAYESKYDVAIETVAEVQGVTDYAAEIDEITQKNCETEKTLQNINFYTGLVAAGGMALSTITLASQYANPITFWMSIIIGAVGAACAVAAVMGANWSKQAAEQQAEMATQVSQEVVIRQSTQDMSADTEAIYDEQIDAFDGTLDFVTQGLKVVKPEDTNAPSDIPSATSVTATNSQEDNDNELKKPKEKD